MSIGALQQAPGLLRVPGEPHGLKSRQRLPEERPIVSGDAESPERARLAERSGLPQFTVAADEHRRQAAEPASAPWQLDVSQVQRRIEAGAEQLAVMAGQRP